MAFLAYRIALHNPGVALNVDKRSATAAFAETMVQSGAGSQVGSRT